MLPSVGRLFRHHTQPKPRKTTQLNMTAVTEPGRRPSLGQGFRLPDLSISGHIRLVLNCCDESRQARQPGPGGDGSGRTLPMLELMVYGLVRVGLAHLDPRGGLVYAYARAEDRKILRPQLRSRGRFLPDVGEVLPGERRTPGLHTHVPGRLRRDGDRGNLWPGRRPAGPGAHPGLPGEGRGPWLWHLFL